MVKRTGPTSVLVNKSISALTKTKKGAYISTADKLRSPRRIKTVMNLNKINRLANDGEILIIQGKILSIGELTKKNLTLSSQEISETALSKIKKSKNNYISLRELVKKNPEAKKVRILK